MSSENGSTGICHIPPVRWFHTTAKANDPYMDFDDEPTEQYVMWLEIADCKDKVKLHRAYKDTPEEFIEKMKKLRMHIDDFITFLEEEHGY